LIAELTNPYLEHGELKCLIREKAGREYEIPYSQRKHISEECIRNWLKDFRKYGKEGLLPKKRSDWGSNRSLNPEEASQLIQYLEEHPELTATTCLRELQRQGKIISPISSSSLSRLVRASGMDRESRMHKAQQEKNLKFDFFYPLECVQADDLFAFAVPDGKGGRRKAILMSFLDDATRRVLYANFSFTERSVQFEAGIKHILKAHGRIGMLYVDYPEKKQMPKFMSIFFPSKEIALKKKRESLAQYLARPPISLKKVSFESFHGKVLFHTHYNDYFKENLKLFDASDFIALLTLHLPSKGVQYLRRYGLYSSRSRGTWADKPHVAALAPEGWKQKRPDSQDSHEGQNIYDADAPVCSTERRAAWARLIAKVYEVDPMVCARCGSPMRILAIITDPEEVKKILRHLAKTGKPPPGLDASSLN
jgi:transposase